MNTKIISKFLQLLRKKYGYTQEDLAKKLNISRQAISKWETGNTIPDLDTLLKISKLYKLTINEILEPNIQPQIINDFEQISTIPENQLKEILKQFNINDLTKALMGASPKIDNLFIKLFPDIDYKTIQNNIGKIRVDEIENIQNEIISMINLEAIDKENILR